MNNRGSSSSATALRRLMTEYKQLTSGVYILVGPWVIVHHTPNFTTVVVCDNNRRPYFRVGLLYMGGVDMWPERYTLCKSQNIVIDLCKLTRSQEGGVFVAKLTFPTDYPLSPFKMRFDPPIFHPNSTFLYLVLFQI
ncbi:hypothetical protein ID866_4777 [Astraeus odoratus]|nr:hypothetical protein ID866_4777 [Astraeus odoratus]